MNAPLLQLLVLAGIAIFLILRLRSVLGTREGFEKPQVPAQSRPKPDLEVIEGGPDADIVDHVQEGSGEAEAIARMKAVEPSFSLGEFMQGARGAYEMILMGFEKGDLQQIEQLLSEDVYASFADVVRAREEQGYSVDATFVGLSGIEVTDARFDEASQFAEITLRFVGELTSVVRNSAGEIVEGDPNTIHKQRDIWTFGRTMGRSDPNWELIATEA